MTMSRRRVLAALAAAGGAGALTAGGTRALLTDDGGLGADLTTGLVDIVVDYWQDDGTDPIDRDDPDGSVDGPTVTLPTDTVDESSDGRTVLRVSLPRDGGPNNPASLWLRADCPTRSTLAEALNVALSYADSDGTPTGEIASGSVREVATWLRTGRRLDGDPTTPAPDCLSDEVFLVLESDLGPYVGTGTVSLPLTLVATQCRNADPGVNPFPADAVDAPCVPGYDCPDDPDDCWAVFKVEFEDAPEVGRRYDSEGDDGTYGYEGLAGYGIRVTDTDGDSGVAFELVASGDAPPLPLCSVAVKGGPPQAEYDRTDGAFGFDTGVLAGAQDGLVYAPENPNSGGRYGISYVLVSVCAPRLADGTYPEPVVEPAASTGERPGRGPAGGDTDDGPPGPPRRGSKTGGNR